jgi:hypothetical protein
MDLVEELNKIKEELGSLRKLVQAQGMALQSIHAAQIQAAFKVPGGSTTPALLEKDIPKIPLLQTEEKSAKGSFAISTKKFLSKIIR